MGHIITKDATRPDPEKVRAILEMPVPENHQAVQRFIGMVTYLNVFCPLLSDIIHPLQQLLKTDMQFTWSAMHVQAFQKAKEAIATAPWLAFFDPSKPAIRQTDASDSALDAVLLQ